MSVTGVTKNGVIVLPPNVELPEGTGVRVETLTHLSAEDDPLVAAAERLAKPHPHLPQDYALNHGHYVRGELKKRGGFPLP